MQMPSRTFNTTAYKRGYNGMEKDQEIKGDGNSYTTEFRQYDPRLGRWLSLDPLMAQFPSMSPYVAFNNNPILYNDPLGLAATNDGGGDKDKDKDKESKVDRKDNNRLYNKLFKKFFPKHFDKVEKARAIKQELERLKIESDKFGETFQANVAEHVLKPLRLFGKLMSKLEAKWQKFDRFMKSLKIASEQRMLAKYGKVIMVDGGTGEMRGPLVKGKWAGADATTMQTLGQRINNLGKYKGRLWQKRTEGETAREAIERVENNTEKAKQIGNEGAKLLEEAKPQLTVYVYTFSLRSEESGATSNAAIDDVRHMSFDRLNELFKGYYTYHPEGKYYEVNIGSGFTTPYKDGTYSPGFPLK